MVKIAIHHNNHSFSEKWIEFCVNNNLNFSVVNCLENDIIYQLKGFSHLLWHWSHNSIPEILVAKTIIRLAEDNGIKVFPNSETCWHFDDKLAQKYLFESLDLPRVNTYLCFSKEEANKLINTLKFPVVSKLRKGAGSQNVKLINNKIEAISHIRQSFGKGIKCNEGYFSDFTKKKKQAIKNKRIIQIIKNFPTAAINNLSNRKNIQVEKGYTYFQEFVPDNDYDTRVTIIGSRAFAFRRKVRENDFRASGSGQIDYNPKKIDSAMIKKGFYIADKTKAQTIAMDFVNEKNNGPLLLEISYCFDGVAIHNCPGYWDKDLIWHSGNIWPQEVIIQDLLG